MMKIYVVWDQRDYEANPDSYWLSKDKAEEEAKRLSVREKAGDGFEWRTYYVQEEETSDELAVAP
jgi:hypothetical protein